MRMSKRVSAPGSDVATVVPPKLSNEVVEGWLSKSSAHPCTRRQPLATQAETPTRRCPPTADPVPFSGEIPGSLGGVSDTWPQTIEWLGKVDGWVYCGADATSRGRCVPPSRPMRST